MAQKCWSKTTKRGKLYTTCKGFQANDKKAKAAPKPAPRRSTRIAALRKQPPRQRR